MPRFSMETIPQPRRREYPIARDDNFPDLWDPHNDPEMYLNGCDPNALGMTESEFFGDVGDK